MRHGLPLFVRAALSAFIASASSAHAHVTLEIEIEIEITRSPVATPITSHGRRVTDNVSRIRWHGGRIDPAHFDEFVLLAKLPEAPGPLYWKVTRVCETGHIDWAQVLDVVPAAPAAAHVH